MLISIITATFNSAKTIETTIQSMLGQTWQDWEYLIMDGGSTDDTLQIVRNYETQFQGRLRLISEPDKSLYDALNKGMRLAQGEVIGLLHSDDFFTGNDRLEGAKLEAVGGQEAGACLVLPVALEIPHVFRPEHVQDAILYFGRFPFRQKSTT